MTFTLLFFAHPADIVKAFPTLQGLRPLQPAISTGDGTARVDARLAKTQKRSFENAHEFRDSESASLASLVIVLYIIRGGNFDLAISPAPHLRQCGSLGSSWAVSWTRAPYIRPINARHFHSSGSSMNADRICTIFHRCLQGAQKTAE